AALLLGEGGGELARGREEVVDALAGDEGELLALQVAEEGGRRAVAGGLHLVEGAEVGDGEAAGFDDELRERDGRPRQRGQRHEGRQQVTERFQGASGEASALCDAWGS